MKGQRGQIGANGQIFAVKEDEVYSRVYKMYLNWNEWGRAMTVDPKDAGAVDWAIAHHISVFTTQDTSCANVPTHAGYRFQVKPVEIGTQGQAQGSLTA